MSMTMKRVIKSFENFHESFQEEIYEQFLNGELARATFPYKGEIADGVLFPDEEDTVFLIPISSIKASKLASADDDDDDDDRDDGDDAEFDSEELSNDFDDEE